MDNSEKWQHRVHLYTRQEKQKHNTICVGHHYTIRSILSLEWHPPPFLPHFMLDSVMNFYWLRNRIEPALWCYRIYSELCTISSFPMKDRCIKRTNMTKIYNQRLNLLEYPESFRWIVGRILCSSVSSVPDNNLL